MRFVSSDFPLSIGRRQFRGVTKSVVSVPYLTMVRTTEVIPVSGKPTIRFLANWANKRNRENPRDEFSFRQNIEQLLDRCRALPRFAIASTNELQRFDVRALRYPRETLFDSRSLRRNNLELTAPVPF